jgi:hypothetical protein
MPASEKLETWAYKYKGVHMDAFVIKIVWEEVKNFPIFKPITPYPKNSLHE